MIDVGLKDGPSSNLLWNPLHVASPTGQWDDAGDRYVSDSNYSDLMSRVARVRLD
jgi:hypothetical protein